MNDGFVKGPQHGFPFMVRYPFDTLTVLSKVEGLTTNAIPAVTEHCLRSP